MIIGGEGFLFLLHPLFGIWWNCVLQSRKNKEEKMNKDKIFKLAKGFRGRAKNCIRIARERVEKALQYSYRDRRNKKRDMRSLWIQRINAGTRIHGVCLLTPFLLSLIHNLLQFNAWSRNSIWLLLFSSNFDCWPSVSSFLPSKNLKYVN